MLRWRLDLSILLMEDELFVIGRESLVSGLRVQEMGSYQRTPTPGFNPDFPAAAGSWREIRV